MQRAAGLAAGGAGDKAGAPTLLELRAAVRSVAARSEGFWTRSRRRRYPLG